MTTQEKEPPIKVFKAGGVRAAIWPRSFEASGREVATFTVLIERTYKQGPDFKATNRFDVRDLPKVGLVVRKAYEFLTLDQPEGEAESGG